MATPGGVTLSKRLTETQVREAHARVIAGASQASVAASLGVSGPALSYQWKKFNLGTTKKSTEIVSSECGHCHQTFRHHRTTATRQYCSVPCRSAAQSGRNHPRWKDESPRGGYKGYVMVERPRDHKTRSNRHRGRIPEHVLKAEQVLGRPLRSHEVVHHINGDKTDNRNCNLVICDRSYHLWLHQKMSYLYQREHFGSL